MAIDKRVMAGITREAEQRMRETRAALAKFLIEGATVRGTGLGECDLTLVHPDGSEFYLSAVGDDHTYLDAGYGASEKEKSALRDVPGMRDTDAQFILSRCPAYPWLAQAPTSMSPTTVTECGHHVSVRLRVGWRLWGFETEAGRDRFVSQYGGRVFP